MAETLTVRQNQWGKESPRWNYYTGTGEWFATIVGPGGLNHPWYRVTINRTGSLEQRFQYFSDAEQHVHKSC